VDPSVSAISLNREIGARSFGSVIGLDQSDRSAWGWSAGYLACYCYLGLWAGLTVCDSCALARLGRELSRLANTSDRQLSTEKNERGSRKKHYSLYATALIKLDRIKAGFSTEFVQWITVLGAAVVLLPELTLARWPRRLLLGIGRGELNCIGPRGSQFR
jgi:hypothetical protein